MKYKKEDLQAGMLVLMHRNRDKNDIHGNDLGMVVNTNIGVCIIDEFGHSIELDRFDDNLQSFHYTIATIYGFAPPHEATKFNINNREILK